MADCKNDHQCKRASECKQMSDGQTSLRLALRVFSHKQTTRINGIMHSNDAHVNSSFDPVCIQLNDLRMRVFSDVYVCV